MNQLPKIRTQKDRDREDREVLTNGTEREKTLLWLKTFSANSQALPSTDDLDEIHSNARHEFSALDFSNAMSHVDSAIQVAGFYRDLAENYLQGLTDMGAVVDEWGTVTHEPFVLLNKRGEHILGRPEVIQMGDSSPSDIWYYYVQHYLPFASPVEKNWIAEKFATEIEQETEDV